VSSRPSSESLLVAGFEPADVTEADVIALAGISLDQLHRYIGRTIPSPDLRLSKHRMRWRRSTVERWLNGEQPQEQEQLQEQGVADAS
jgi:predicted DNA-binding transcriptional regulator AlpA